MDVIWVCLGMIVALAGMYLFLICPRMFYKPDRSHLYGVHYAHRGLFDNKSEAPENSLPAFRKAVEHGYGIEMDVQLSKDGIPVVFHDATLERMCGIEGNVWDYTLEELQKMKLAESDATIPTFAEVLEEIRGRVPLIIEYKMDRPDTVVCEKGNALLEAYQGPYCMESFHPYAVRWYRKHRPDVVRGQLSMEFWREPKYKGRLLYVALGCLMFNVLGRPDFIAYEHSHASNISRRICRRLGALAVAWTIRSKEDYHKAKDNFDLFIFDSCRL